MRSWLCLAVVLLAASSAQAGFFDRIATQLSFLFHSYEEAPYTVTRTTQDYEERVYSSKKWVCTEATGSDKTVMEGLFWRLFQYISGQNSKHENIDMTVPVSTEYTIRGATDKTYRMCFFIGAAHQDDPATPTNEQVFIEDRPQMTVLTRRVGGYIMDEREWMEEAGKLAALIQENGETVHLNHMFWVGYDAPFKFFNRRNEVWFIVN